MIPIDSFRRGVPQRYELRTNRASERSYGDLDIDDVLRRKARNRGRTDVINPQRVSQSTPQLPADRLKLCRPALLILDDLHHIASAYRSGIGWIRKFSPSKSGYSASILRRRL